MLVLKHKTFIFNCVQVRVLDNLTIYTILLEVCQNFMTKVRAFYKLFILIHNKYSQENYLAGVLKGFLVVARKCCVIPIFVFDRPHDL